MEESEEPKDRLNTRDSGLEFIIETRLARKKEVNIDMRVCM
jgi:hypothetical protein